MLINKIGYSHLQDMKNCQDYGFEYENIKCVVDGCSEGLHSEVGAKLFCHIYQNSKENINRTIKIFNKLTSIFCSVEDIKNYLLFTNLFVYERNSHFMTSTCGDGIIIKQKYDDTFEYEIIEQNGKPKYFAYNYVPKEYLKDYFEEISFICNFYYKTDYKAIGVATDGLQYILDSPFKKEFEKYLKLRKRNRINLLINREHKFFKDDITLVI